MIVELIFQFCLINVTNWYSFFNSLVVYNFNVPFLKVVSTTFLLVCFLFLKESTCETLKSAFYFTSKLFSFLRKSNFRILDIQIPWRHQIPKHKTRNTCYWITWKVNTVSQWLNLNLASLWCHITKEKILSKNSKKTATWKLVPGPFVFAKN